MNHRDRLERMRALRDRVERLPASPERDRMLSEIRARAVDIESGERTAPMRPLAPEAPSPEPARPTTNDVPVQHPRRTRPRTSTPTHTTSVRADPARTSSTVPGAVAAASAPHFLLEEGVRLCLDDGAAVVAIEVRDNRLMSPWARGLRG
jgi:hypothetical protein